MRRRLRRISLIALGFLLVVALWFGWYAYDLYQGISHITSVGVPRATGEPTHIATDTFLGNQRINILVLGSDNDRKSEEKYPLTQSMIVVSIDPVNDRVTMLSIPRDFWVKIGSYGMAKIDLASQYGSKHGGFSAGIQLARQTVEQLFHVYIDYYAWVGLNGFQSVIDTFGGITLDVKHPILDDYYPDDITPTNPYGFRRVFIAPGWRHLSGAQALQYVRSRHADAIGDFGRSDRQQQVLLQLRQKVNGMDILSNLSSLVDDLQGSVRTDLSISQIYDLYQLSHKIPSSSVSRYTLPAPVYCTYGQADSKIGVQDVLFPNWGRILPLTKRLFAPIRPLPQAKVLVTPTPVPLPTSTPHSGATPTRPAAETPTAVARAAPTPTLSTGTAWSGDLPATAVLVKNGQIDELTPAGNLVTLSPWSGGSAMPAVSADGRKVAFVQYRGWASDLLVLRRGNSADPSPASLTHDENKDIHANLWALSPAWSPDGKSLLFSWDAQKLALPESESRPIDPAIWSVSARGGTPQRLTTPDQGAGGDSSPQWRPHSREIMFIRWSYDQANQPAGILTLQDTVAGNVYPLTSPTARVLQAQIDPSGKRVTYIRTGLDGVDQLDVAPILDGPGKPHLGTPTILATGMVAQPAFTPGGKWVSFLKANGDGFSLYLEASTGGTQYSVPAAGNDVDSTSRPVWTR